MNLNFKKNRGFTIIEMMVVVTLITVFLGITISNFPNIRDQFALSQTAYKFAQDVRRAQNMAMSSKPYTDSSGVVHPVSGYGIHTKVGVRQNEQYMLYAQADPSCGVGYGQCGSYDVESLDTKPGISFQTFGAGPYGIDINFTSPIPTTTIDADGSGNPVTGVNVVFVIESDPSQTRSVRIFSSGLIEVESH